VGAVITCPLEVVKTRLQSSLAPYQQAVPAALHDVNCSATTRDVHRHSFQHAPQRSRSLGLIHCLR